MLLRLKWFFMMILGWFGILVNICFIDLFRWLSELRDEFGGL